MPFDVQILEVDRRNLKRWIHKYVHKRVHVFYTGNG